MSEEWGTRQQAADLIGADNLEALLRHRMIATRVAGGDLQIDLARLREMAPDEVARIAEEAGL